MSFKRFLISAAVAAAAGMLCGASQAALTAFSTAASFAAAVSSPSTDAFTFLPIDFVASPSTRAAGPYSYVVSAPGGLFGGGSTADPWLSTNLSGAAMTFATFSGGVNAIGGSFFGTDIVGAPLAGQSLTLTATDSLGATSTQTLVSAGPASFLGFASTGSLVSLAVSIADRSAFLSVDNLVLAAPAPVPEPESVAMLLAGLAAVAAAARRRRRPA